MSTLVIALLTSSMFFDSAVKVGELHYRPGFSDSAVRTKIVICRSYGLTSFRAWYDNENRPGAVTRLKCSHER